MALRPIPFSEYSRSGCGGLYAIAEGNWAMLPLFTCAAVEVAWIELANLVPSRWLFPIQPANWGYMALVVLSSVMCVAMPMKIWNNTRIEMNLEQNQQLLLKARMDALTSQINPHFLFNTLNTVSSLIRFDPDMARGVVLKLSNILRRLLRKHETFVPLREELEFIDDYLDIEVIRFGRDKLQIFKEIDDETRRGIRAQHACCSPSSKIPSSTGSRRVWKAAKSISALIFATAASPLKLTTTAWASHPSASWKFTAAASASVTSTSACAFFTATNSRWTFAAKKAKARKSASRFRHCLPSRSPPFSSLFQPMTGTRSKSHQVVIFRSWLSPVVIRKDQHERGAAR